MKEQWRGGLALIDDAFIPLSGHRYLPLQPGRLVISSKTKGLNFGPPCSARYLRLCQWGNYKWN